MLILFLILNLRSDYKNIHFSQYFVDNLDPNFEKFEEQVKDFFLNIKSVILIYNNFS